MTKPLSEDRINRMILTDPIAQAVVLRHGLELARHLIREKCVPGLDDNSRGGSQTDRLPMPAHTGITEES